MNINEQTVSRNLKGESGTPHRKSLLSQVAKGVACELHVSQNQKKKKHMQFFA